MTKTPYLFALTPLRGIAALAIVLHHCHRLLTPLTSSTTGLIEQAYLAVDFFFMLSGFVLAHRYSQSFSEGVDTLTYWSYVKARCRRILPLYYVTLLLTAGCVYGFLLPNASGLNHYWQSVFSVQGLLTSLFLMQGFPFSDVTVWNIPSWSLSVEWWVYLLFPYLWHRLIRPLQTTFHLVAAAVGIIGAYAGLIYHVSPTYGTFHLTNLDLATDFGIVRCLLGFVLGLITYRIYQKKRAITWLAGAYGTVGTPLVIGCYILLSMHQQWPDLIIVLFFPFLILGAVDAQQTLKPILMRPAVQWIGNVSYATYLTHMTLVFFTIATILSGSPNLLAGEGTGPAKTPDLLLGWRLAGPIVLFSLPLAGLFYTYVEKPLRQSRARKKAEIAV